MSLALSSRAEAVTRILITTLSLLQIRFRLLQNRQGKTRLSRWYVSYNEDERKKIEVETHRTIVGRDNKMTSFLEVSHPATDSCDCYECLVQEPQDSIQEVRRPFLYTLR